MSRALLEMIRTIIHGEKISVSFTAKALSVAAHVHTRGLPVTTTPYEVIFCQEPNLSYFRIFGFRCWYKTKRNKLKT